MDLEKQHEFDDKRIGTFFLSPFNIPMQKGNLDTTLPVFHRLDDPVHSLQLPTITPKYRPA